MNINKMAFAGRAVLAAKLFGKRRPLLVGWAITNRCHSRCLYCNAYDNKSSDMETETVFSILDQLSQMGTVAVQFTGGEPLLRSDIGRILEYCRHKQIFTSLSSSGYLVRERISELNSVGRLSLSLDGREIAHDSIRGRGSYQRVMEALEACKRYNIMVSFLAVLSRHNMGEIDFLLKKAEETKTSIFFQPATKIVLKGRKINPIALTDDYYKVVLDYLVKRKKQGNRWIGNTLTGLNYLKDLKDSKKMKCFIGSVFCYIESNGDLKWCGRADDAELPNCIDMGVETAFNTLRYTSCNGECCASMSELSLLLSFRPEAIFNLKRYIKVK